MFGLCVQPVLDINSCTLKDCETVKRDFVLVTEGTGGGANTEDVRMSSGVKRGHIWIVAAAVMVDFLLTLHAAPFRLHLKYVHYADFSNS